MQGTHLGSRLPPVKTFVWDGGFAQPGHYHSHVTAVDAEPILPARSAGIATFETISIMTALQAALQAHASEALATGGLVLGILFGFIAARANFCVMGAISDVRSFSSAGRLGAVALASATALVLTQAFAAAGYIELGRSMYLAPRLNWGGALAGGLLFGAGMVYAGGCASRNLIRAGGGDVRALLVVLCVAIAAFATISGVAAPLRAAFEDATALEPDSMALPIVSLDVVLRRIGLTSMLAALLGTLAIAVPLLAYALLIARVHRDPRNLFAGLAVGLLIAGGWLLTGLSYDEMTLRPVAPHSLSFVRPIGDAIDWLQRSTALGLPGFGAASIFGTLLGSAAACTSAGCFRLSGFSDAGDVRRHLGGAAAMGIGGVMALGCSIGQGITGLSTLSLQSFIAAASIFAGAWLALARLERQL